MAPLFYVKQTTGFSRQTDCSSMVVQIHHLPDRHHWVTSARFPLNPIIYIYDSLVQYGEDSRPIIAPSLRTQLLSIYGPIQSYCVPTVGQQTNSVDCGVYAIAFATDICFGFNPCKRLYINENGQLRRLLYKYMLGKKLSTFS